MSSNDYYVIAYKLMSYLYACLKQGEHPSLEFLESGTKVFPVTESYWEYILQHLFEDGYIEGAKVIPILGKSKAGIRLTPDIMITPKGIEYLEDNSAMQRAKRFIEDAAAITGGMRSLLPWL